MNMDFKSAKELLALCAENALPISEVMRRRECLLGEVEQDAVDRRMAKAWDIMRVSATQPLETPPLNAHRTFLSPIFSLSAAICLAAKFPIVQSPTAPQTSYKKFLNICIPYCVCITSG